MTPERRKQIRDEYFARVTRAELVELLDALDEAEARADRHHETAEGTITCQGCVALLQADRAGNLEIWRDAESRERRLREALEWYADKAVWRLDHPYTTSDAEDDSGARARGALEAK